MSLSAGREDLVDRLAEEFLPRYYREEIGTLAQHYPQEQRSLYVEYDDLFTWDTGFAEDLIDAPDEMGGYLDEALRLFDLPVDVSLGRAHVRVVGLPERHTFYPGGFSPSGRAGDFTAIRGEVVKATDTAPKVEEAAFECQRCGTLTHVPQTRGFQDPHECEGCEREGPFELHRERSEWMDFQVLQIQTPPEIAVAEGQTINVNVCDDATGRAEVGDRVTISGTLALEQRGSGREKKPTFDPYLEGEGIEVEESDHTDIDISDAERERIRELASGAEGDPLDLAVESIATSVHGLERVKRVAALQIVGGDDNSETGRGDIHQLILGDPGTAKSVLLGAIEDLAPRSVGVSAKKATEAGLTASTVRDEFGDGEWALKAGAFVKANGGIVCIDELDDMAPDTRAAMLDPMSKQRIHVTQAGINTHLQTQTAVLAAGNPKHGRFDPFESVPSQFDFAANLISRFDVIFTIADEPDVDRDRVVGDHTTRHREAMKKRARSDLDEDALTDAEKETADAPVSEDLLRKWFALAKQRPAPVSEDDDVREEMVERWVDIRGANGYDHDDPVPVTARNLTAVHRLAEAVARFRLSGTIEERDVRVATNIVGESMQDIGRDEEGQLDADVAETGTSRTQQDRIRTIDSVVRNLQAEHEEGHAEEETLYEILHDEYDISKQKAEHEIQSLKDKGEIYQPEQGYLRSI